MSLSAMSCKAILVGAIALGCTGAGFSPLSAAEKMTPEELVSLHLDAIGPADARTGMKSRMLRGEGVWRVFRGGFALLPATLPATVFEASDGNSISLRFDTRGDPTYYGEHFIHDGKKVRIYQGFPGGRSPLGEFFKYNKALLREGILGGVTSTAWPLLHLEARGAKLEYAGLKQVENRQLHCLYYKPRRGRPEKILLFFEPDTYRHVKTKYHGITETFSNFQDVDGLTLPARWKIHYYSRSRMVAEWEFAFKTVIHNEPIDPALYALGAAAR